MTLNRLQKARTKSPSKLRTFEPVKCTTSTKSSINIARDRTDPDYWLQCNAMHTLKLSPKMAKRWGDILRLHKMWCFCEMCPAHHLQQDDHPCPLACPLSMQTSPFLLRTIPTQRTEGTQESTQQLSVQFQFFCMHIVCYCRTRLTTPDLIKSAEAHLQNTLETLC